MPFPCIARQLVSTIMQSLQPLSPSAPPTSILHVAESLSQHQPQLQPLPSHVVDKLTREMENLMIEQKLKQEAQGPGPLRSVWEAAVRRFVSDNKPVVSESRSDPTKVPLPPSPVSVRSSPAPEDTDVTITSTPSSSPSKGIAQVSLPAPAAPSSPMKHPAHMRRNSSFRSVGL